MAVCSVDVVRHVAKYLGTAPGALAYTSDKVVTTVLGKESVSGFASVVLRLAREAGAVQGAAKEALVYQWLEYAAVYADQAASNQTFAKKFLLEVESALEHNSYLGGQRLSAADVALLFVLHPLLERLSYGEREALPALGRWSRHVRARVDAAVK